MDEDRDLQQSRKPSDKKDNSPRRKESQAPTVAKAARARRVVGKSFLDFGHRGMCRLRPVLLAAERQRFWKRFGLLGRGSPKNDIRMVCPCSRRTLTKNPHCFGFRWTFLFCYFSLATTVLGVVGRTRDARLSEFQMVFRCVVEEEKQQAGDWSGDRRKRRRGHFKVKIIFVSLF